MFGDFRRRAYRDGSAACSRTYPGHIRTMSKTIWSGSIVADAIGTVTIDKNIKAPADCLIKTRNGHILSDKEQ